MTTSLESLYALCPPSVRTALEAVLRLDAAEHNERITLLLPAREAVGLPSLPPPPVLFALPSALSPAQRAFAELCGRCRVPHDAAMPDSPSLLAWLAVEPPTVLEEDITIDGRTAPVWRLLQEGVPGERLLPVLPVEKQLALAAAYASATWAYRVAPRSDFAWTTSIAQNLRGEGEAWARATLAGWTPPTHGVFSGGGTWRRLSLPAGTTDLAFFALARAGAMIEPTWDELLPVGPEVPVAILLECAAALPLERLEQAADKALRQIGGWGIYRGIELLRAYDSRVIADTVIAITANSTPKNRKNELATLLDIGATKPNVKAAVLAATGKAPKPLRLEVLLRMQPRSVSDLSEVQAAQLIAAGERWDGKKLPIERRLARDENDEAALGVNLEHVVIGAKRKPMYEAWLYAGDSGAFFDADTTRLIAERIQRGVVIHGKKDEALAVALDEIAASAAVPSTSDTAAALEAGKTKSPRPRAAPKKKQG
jgi:hypothetical protein